MRPVADPTKQPYGLTARSRRADRGCWGAAEAPETDGEHPERIPDKTRGLPIRDRRQLATGRRQGRIERQNELCKKAGTSRPVKARGMRKRPAPPGRMNQAEGGARRAATKLPVGLWGLWTSPDIG